MNSNNFKKSQNFDNLESNLHHNPAYKAQNYAQQAKDFRSEMKSKNEEATREGFFKKMKADRTDEEWLQVEGGYGEAWESSGD